VARAIGPRDWAGPRSLELLQPLLNESGGQSRLPGTWFRPRGMAHA
jgi:hypothetical protein